jgi:hypothetical protein
VRAHREREAFGERHQNERREQNKRERERARERDAQILEGDLERMVDVLSFSLLRSKARSPSARCSCQHSLQHTNCTVAYRYTYAYK